MDNIVYWCLRQSPETTIGISNLSPAERNTYHGFRFEPRRISWLAGRFTAKSLVSTVHFNHYCPDQIEIRNNDLGAPCAYHANQPLPGCLSISHSGDWAAAAYALSGLRVGIDFEKTAPRSAGFIQDYFTPIEVEMVSAGEPQQGHPGVRSKANQQAERATLIWSAKEALLKALGIGLRQDTRQVEVVSIEDEVQGTPAGWMRLTLSSTLVSSPVDAYWHRFDPYLVTLAVLKGASPNITLIEV